MLITRRLGIAAALAAACESVIGANARTLHKKLSLDPANTIEVRAEKGAIAGTLRFAGQTYRCTVGKSGIVNPKYEGDGGTPEGLFPLREVRYRADRVPQPKSGLPVFKASQSDGWCDDPEDPAYNKIVHLPYQTDAEQMWRDDHLYDVLAVIGYNDAPAMPGAGSAIFMHVMRPPTDDHQYTAGCVALAMPDLLSVLAATTPSTMIRIRAVHGNTT